MNSGWIMEDEKKTHSIDEMMQGLVSHAKIVATVDFEKLESEGVIEKVRGGYLVKILTSTWSGDETLGEVNNTYQERSQNIAFKPPKNFLDLANKN